MVKRTMADDPWPSAGDEHEVDPTSPGPPARPPGAGLQLTDPVNCTDQSDVLVKENEMVVPAGSPSGAVASTVTV